MMKIIAFLLIIFFSFLPLAFPAHADDVTDLQKRIDEAQNQLNQAKAQAKTLKTQLDFIDGQTKLTQLKTDQANAQLARLQIEINSLNERITDLSGKVDSVSEILLNRIVQTYKFGNIGLIDLLFSSQGFGDLLQSYKYIQVAQAHDKELLYRLQATKTTYNESKTDKETRQIQQEKLKKDLASYQKQLEDQKKSKEELLRITKNNEANYQVMLAQARAEYLAIQGIVAGKGTEVEVRQVSQGERIASIIDKASCNSSGAHLHFTVVNNNSERNPFDFLKSISHVNCSGYGSSCPTSGGEDPFDPRGDWDWPINGPIQLNQGWGGATWAIRSGVVPYNFHNGLDIEGYGLEVKAVKSGKLFRGSYSVGCALPYVRVKHDDGGLETLYLHVYY